MRRNIVWIMLCMLWLTQRTHHTYPHSQADVFRGEHQSAGRLFRWLCIDYEPVDYDQQWSSLWSCYIPEAIPADRLVLDCSTEPVRLKTEKSGIKQPAEELIVWDADGVTS